MTLVHRDALAAMKDLDDARGEAHLDGGLVLAQRVRDGIRMVIDGDVVIDIDARAFPLGVLEARRRERTQRRPVEALEEVTPARTAVLSAASVKKTSCRSRATIRRSATCTATSTLALSRGLAGRAGRIVVP